ncbi:class II fructose-bisphosphate aldolase [Frondihabitans peucedani]|uniref:Class II fructose-bisphosphate aldolase n=1 Tax=Frondihabitans peucedani TaxID=598626 RepID=A0ABP8E5K7_9MICO
MRIRLDDLVASRLAEGAAVPAFTCYDFTTALAVVSAAEEVGQGVIILITPKTASMKEGLRLVAAVRALADAAVVPVAVQLDHAPNLDLILSAVAAGADSVLADASAAPFADNVAFVRHVRSATDALGVVVEAELGSIAGDEDRSLAVEASGKTDSLLVAEFVASSHAQLLATSVGNVHGSYAGVPKLDWPLISDVRAASPVPLSLHGASGLPDEDLRRAPAAGLGKINFNTELRAAIFDAVEAQLSASRATGDDMLAYERACREAVRQFTLSTLEKLAGR